MPGPLISPVDADSASDFPTRADFRHALADELGAYQSAALSATASADSGDAARLMIAEELRDDEWDRAVLGDVWAYVVDGAVAPGEQRRVLDAGYEGPMGGLLASRPFPAALAQGTTVEITSPLPCTRIGTVKGLNQIIDEALAKFRVPARIALTGNGTQRYTLQDTPFITGKAETLGIYDSRWQRSGGPTRLSESDYDIEVDGATITLQTTETYGTSETFELAVLVRADRLISDGATWAYASTPGLTAETAQAAAPIAWVLPFAMTIALDYLLAYNERDPRIDAATRARREVSYTRRLEDRWAPAMAKLVREILPRRPTDPPRRLAHETAGRGRRWR